MIDSVLRNSADQIPREAISLFRLMRQMVVENGGPFPALLKTGISQEALYNITKYTEDGALHRIR